MIATYLAFATAVALLIASPGPVVALVVADARRRWPLWTILGGLLSAQLLMVAALTLIHLALDLEPALLEAGQVLGGLYLIWLGRAGLRGGTDMAEPPRRSESHHFWRAMAVGLSNPKDILFFLAFLPGFILPTQPFAAQAAALSAIWAVIDLGILLAYALLARHLASHGRISHLLRRLPACCLLGLGVSACAFGITQLLQ